MSDADCCWSQLPRDQERDDDRLHYFLRGLPEWMGVAVELRHPSWAVDPVFDLLSRHDATYVVMSGAGLRCVLRASVDMAYSASPSPGESRSAVGRASMYADAPDHSR